MTHYCIKCSSVLDPFYNYCPYCGYEAPRGTIMPDEQPVELSEGIYCVHCGKLNVADGLFCSECGHHLYERPQGEFLLCPKCGKRNKSDADFCYHCAQNFGDWFAMRGKIARELGWRGSFVLHETMNDVYYHFLRQPTVWLGRAEQNDIVLPSGWVSGRHCRIDVQNWRLTDTGSTNGTFVNRKAERITSLSLDMVQEFNLAGVFTFTVLKKRRLFIFRLTAILDQEGLKREGRLDDFNELRKHYFILVGGNGTIDVRKMDGEILTAGDEMMEFFTVDVREDGYYFTDRDHDLKERLLLKKYNNLPVNWRITFVL